MQLILIRHGETLWNREGRVQGVSDVELSTTGMEQARKLARSLAKADIGVLHASPLKRAYQTADIINRFHGKTIHIHRELMEMDQGDFEGRSFQELMMREKDFIRQWKADPASLRMPGGESLADLQERAWKAMEAIMAENENALVVSHNFTIAAILCRLSGIRLSEFRNVCVDNASKTLLRVQNGEARIDLHNDLSHLDLPPEEI